MNILEFLAVIVSTVKAAHQLHGIVLPPFRQNFQMTNKSKIMYNMSAPVLTGNVHIYSK